MWTRPRWALTVVVKLQNLLNNKCTRPQVWGEFQWCNDAWAYMFLGWLEVHQERAAGEIIAVRYYRASRHQRSSSLQSAPESLCWSTYSSWILDEWGGRLRASRDVPCLRYYLVPPPPPYWSCLGVDSLLPGYSGKWRCTPYINGAMMHCEHFIALILVLYILLMCYQLPHIIGLLLNIATPLITVVVVPVYHCLVIRKAPVQPVTPRLDTIIPLSMAE